ncbi:16S rRNA (uracil(1498)-N(3))-methyltransferase [Pseudolactococcus insecticola]|uniref:Ribosomal RNA small subunit methyltransferase E n=1 Tax=Pseudolactococcus insecticola TaxID=2709158 RepID=A0A6A0B673_9LACT|nr:16S rRNA (uracil(1498)-N(3))-methyltransferase [Lactococcus insecticola]GFH40456.1 ribosomal RNA small subunit methyltransferase E [Lactococcus insecticola]
MQQYFSKQAQPAENTDFTLDAADSYHLFTVMRAQENEQVQVVFADKKLTLSAVNADLKSLRVLHTLERQIELPLDVTIAVGLPKSDKLEFITQKATELGAHEILAYPAEWSVTKLDAKKIVKKTERLNKIAKGAAEQSKRLMIPDVTILPSRKNLLTLFSQYDQVLVAYEESAKSGELAAFAQSLKTAEVGQKLLVIFGPEGGISPDEIVAFTAEGASLIGLGPRIMRAETAPLYVLSAVSFYQELLK